MQHARPHSFPKSTKCSLNHGAPPARLASVLLLPCLTALKRRDTIPLIQLIPLDESVAARLCPPTAIGWKARASHPSKPCRAKSALAGCAYSVAGQVASALHTMAVLQVFQAKMLASEEAGLDAASLRDLRSATDLSLRTTKAIAQTIGRSMSSLVVLEHLEGIPARQDATPS